MATRTTLRGNGMPGGQIQYHGDLPNLVASNYDPRRRSSVGQRLSVVATTIRTGAAVVSRIPRRGGHEFYYSHGAVRMRTPTMGPPAYGSVVSSPFQPNNVQLMDWQNNRSWHEAGYPRNLALATKTPQLSTNATGGPGKSRSTQRPLFTRVQQVRRPLAVVPTFATRSGR